MQLKTYTLACHGCGAVHEKQACFISSPMSLSVEGGWSLPVHGCPACMAIGEQMSKANGGKRAPESPIAKAYDRGITSETFAALVANWAEYIKGHKACKHCHGFSPLDAARCINCQRSF